MDQALKLALETGAWVTTATVLARLNDRNDAAWNDFVARFSGPLRAFAVRMGLPQPDADDAIQETLLAFAEAYRAGQFDATRGRLSSWLFGIAYRQFANSRRRLAAAGARRDAGGAHSTFWERMPDEQTARGEWTIAWEQHTLETCLHQVRQEVAENTFRAFEMTVREGRSPEQAAEALGMTRNAVYVAKHRVLERLAELAGEFEEREQ